MDIFAQKKLLIRIIILLIALNVLSVSVFLWKECFHKPPPRENNQREENRDVSAVLKKELSLNDSQVEAIKVLRTDFFEKENVISSAIKSERDSMNQIMYSQSANEELLTSLAQKIADNGYQMELLRVAQAKQLKSICQPEQLEKFQGLVKEIRDYFRPEKNNNKH
ncbi:MAG: hypothetical protein WCH34_14840 [Bacteroidota bacterium]